MLSLFVEMMEPEQRRLYVVSVCGNNGNRTEKWHVVSGCGNDGNRTENIVICMLSVFVEMMETEQRTLYIACGNDGNRTGIIACCQWL